MSTDVGRAIRNEIETHQLIADDWLISSIVSKGTHSLMEIPIPDDLDDEAFRHLQDSDISNLIGTFYTNHLCPVRFCIHHIYLDQFGEVMCVFCLESQQSVFCPLNKRHRRRSEFPHFINYDGTIQVLT